VILVRASDAAPVPWKNGGGVTRELLRLPADGSDDWTLRISVADIDADGPFSPFPGVTRWFAVVEGPGVRLRWPDRAVHLRRGDAALRFDGADAPDCTLLGASTRDLNVMVREARGSVALGAAAFDDETSPGFGETLGFFALRAVTLHGASDRPVEVPALSLAWNDPPSRAGQPWRLKESQSVPGDQEHTLPGYWIRLQCPIR
jgi:hypothetical protein